MATKTWRDGFYDGVLAAMAVLRTHSEDMLARELADSVGLKKLLKHADEHDLENLRALGVVSSNAGVKVPAERAARGRSP